MALPPCPVIRQLAAYNKRDIDAFASCFAEDVEVSRNDEAPSLVGRTALRRHYAAMFDATPDLHCELVHRVRIGDRVIDEERVHGRGDGVLHAVAIYRLRGGLIDRVHLHT